MKLKINSVHFTADIKLLDFVKEKVGKLEVFFDRVVEGQIYLRVNNEQGEENKTVEITLIVPGKQLFAKEKAKTFEEATVLATDALEKQLKRFKSKLKKR